MTYYQLDQHVRLISGAVSHCLFHGSSGAAYHINSDTLGLLQQLATQGVDGLGAEETNLIEQFEQAGLVRTVEEPGPLTILEISPSDDRRAEFAWIEVTQRCNMRCLHCYEDSSPTTGDEMAERDFHLAMHRLCDYGVRKIQFIGGEPLLLGSRLTAYIRQYRDRFDSVEVFTNATLLKDPLVKELKALDVRVALSLHSSDEAQHDRMTRTRGSFKRTTRGIELLRSHAVKYRTCGVEIAEIDAGQTNAYAINKRDLVRLTGRADFALYNDAMLRRKLITQDNFRRVQSLSDVRAKATGHNCFARNIYIDCHLEVFPCVMERRFSHGNLRSGALGDILDPGIRHLTKDRVASCAACEYRYFCFDCRPDACGAGKFAKPWYCTYVPETGTWASPDAFIATLKAKYRKESDYAELQI
ncbi:MAG: putative Fe-S oxidoreductase [Proteobacteria bacterium]|nr:putative Fe-S oxidoreductase [Pseudomonadota bacterium]